MYKQSIIYFCAAAMVFGQENVRPINSRSSEIEIAPSPQRKIQNFDLYPAFFRHIAFLEKRADEFEAKGEPGTLLRGFYQNKIGLSDIEDANLKIVVKRCLEALKVEDHKTKLYWDTNWEILSSSEHAIVPNWNKVRMEVQQLTEERIKIINQHIDILKAIIHDTGFAKIEIYLHDDFAQHISILSINTVKVNGEIK